VGREEEIRKGRERTGRGGEVEERNLVRREERERGAKHS